MTRLLGSLWPLWTPAWAPTREELSGSHTLISFLEPSLGAVTVHLLQTRPTPPCSAWNDNV